MKEGRREGRKERRKEGGREGGRKEKSFLATYFSASACLGV